MATYTPNVEDTTEPKESRGMGSAAAEFRAIKRRLAEAWSRIGSLGAAFTALSGEVDTRMDAVESSVAGITTELVGQVMPFMRPGFTDLESWLLCDSRSISPDASILEVPHINADLAGELYRDLFKWIWTTLAYSRVQWYAASPAGLGQTDPFPLTIAKFDLGVTNTWIPISMPDPSVVADWEAAWNDPNALYGVYLPDLRGRAIRGSNPMNGVTAIPPSHEPDSVLAARPDYGRLIGSAQHGSMLSGDTDANALVTLGCVQQSRERLGWDKVGADVTITGFTLDGDGLPDAVATSVTGTGYPYPELATSPAPPAPIGNLDRMLVTAVGGTASGITTSSKGSLYASVLGVARMDNFSLPMYIRYK